MESTWWSGKTSSLDPCGFVLQSWKVWIERTCSLCYHCHCKIFSSLLIPLCDPSDYNIGCFQCCAQYASLRCFLSVLRNASICYDNRAEYSLHWHVRLWPRRSLATDNSLACRCSVLGHSASGKVIARTTLATGEELKATPILLVCFRWDVCLGMVSSIHVSMAQLGLYSLSSSLARYWREGYYPDPSLWWGIQ